MRGDRLRLSQALSNLMKGRTTLVIAHRLATVRNASCILVIDGGEVKETGTHEELLRRPDGLYSRLYKLQFRPDVYGRDKALLAVMKSDERKVA